MINGITEVNLPAYATLHQATVSFQEMGDRTISTQVRIAGDVVPSFIGTDGNDWTLMFRGQKFIMPVRKPQASKSNDRRDSIVDLTFQHWAIYELKRYYFVQMAAVTAGVAVADKYQASLAVTLPEFVDALNQVLTHWTNGKIVASLYSSTYDQTKSYVDINYSHIWEVLQKIYEIFSVRWYLEYNSSTDVYTIKINYPATELSHEFEYGFSGGLLKFERNVQSSDIKNILLGRGGEKNLPAYYFKTAPLGSLFASDPDACPELENVYFDNLRGKSFRDYIKGWNHAHHGGEAMQNPTWAYTKGTTDTTFNPVEFLKDDESISDYGEIWGAIENQDNIYPSIQGVKVFPFGRVDEVVAVEEVTTDDIESATDASNVITNFYGTKSLNTTVAAGETTHTIRGGSFTVPSGLTGRLSWSWFKEFTGDSYNPDANVYVDRNTAHSFVKVYNSQGIEVNSQAIPAGSDYYWVITIRMVNNNAYAMTGTFGAQEMKLTISNTDSAAWKPTFDIWVKNIWNTTKGANETDDDYVERVWSPILRDRAGNEAAVVFSDGWLAQSSDWEFVILGNIFNGIHYDTSKTYNGVQSHWRITLQKTDAELESTGLYIPNARTNGNAVAGNHFFFIGVDMPYQYVLLAENKLDTYKENQLDECADINPTWAVTLDKIRIEQQDTEGVETYRIIDKLDAGALVNIKDSRYTYNPTTQAVDTLQLYLQSVTITWQEGKIIPDVEVVLSDTVAAVLSPVEQLQGDVSVLKAQAVELSNIEAVVNKIASTSYLKKTGESQKSYSPTSFASILQSTDFRQGDIGGKGWGLYRSNAVQDSDEYSDLAGDESEHPSSTQKRAYLEVDELTVRHTMRVNQLVVNQISYEGGKQIISAAGIECTEAYADRIVVSGAYKDVYICKFNQKRGSVANLFQVGDVALGQVFSASNVEVKYYRRKVVACGEDYIALSNVSGEYSGAGVPSSGDMIVQYGSYTNPARRYAIIRDVIGGGYERMLSGLSDVNSAGVEYYFAGQQTGTGMRWFIGDNGQYARWTPNDGLEIAGKITVKSGSTGLTGFVEYETLQDTIDALEDNVIDVNQALFDINSDTVLDDSEKAQLRTVWEQMNGLASLDAVGSGGSYLSTVALLEELEYEGETVTLSFHGQNLIFNGNSLEFHYIGVADFTMAFYNVREYLRLMTLYEAGAVQNFERQHLAELLTKYNKLQEDLLAKAQKRYADNTAGAQLEEFIEGEYAQDISDIYDQIDKKAETWAQTTDPSVNWSAAEKIEHAGDIWWNTSANTISGISAGNCGVYRNGAWVETNVPEEVFDEIDGKASLYVSKPSSYHVRDMWIIETGATNIPTGCTVGDLVVAIQDSDSYSPLHWVKKVKYTDDTALQSFIENEYADDIDDLQEQIDKKAETWAQTTDPSVNWSAAEKIEHAGDIWWNTSANTISGISAGNCGVYRNGAWVETNVPEEVFDEIDGKASLYVSKPSSYHVRDMWIIETGATNIPTGCTVGDLVVAIQDSDSYSPLHWVKKVKYTDDNTVTNFINGTYSEFVQNIQSQVDEKTETFYQFSDPSTSWTTAALKSAHIGDLWYNTSATTIAGIESGQAAIWTGSAWKVSAVPKDVFDQIDGKAAIYNRIPANPNINDLLIPTSNFTQDGKTYYANYAYKYNGSNWVEFAYTDDAALTNFINNTYNVFARDIQNQVDGKVETWYQSTNPAANWSTQEKTDHKGDIWYNTSSSTIAGVEAGQSAIWSGSAWIVSAVPFEVFDAIDGKSSIYVTMPTSPDKGDLLIPTTDFTSGGVTYRAGLVYKYTGSAWEEVSYAANTDCAITVVEKETLRKALADINSSKTGTVSVYKVQITGRATTMGNAWSKIEAEGDANFGWYVSNNHEHGDRAVTTITVVCNTATNLVVHIMSRAESSFDSACLSPLDTALTWNTASSGGVTYYIPTNQVLLTSGKEGQDLTYIYALTPGTHTFQVAYRKDSSTSTAPDNGYYKVEDIVAEGTLAAWCAFCDKNGDTTRKAAAISAANALFSYMVNTLNVWGNVTTYMPNDSFRDTMRSLFAAYYISINKIETDVIGSDLNFLKAVFSKATTTITGGVVDTAAVVAKVAVVTDDDSKVVAGINGTKEVGYDATHKKLMFFGGANGLANAASAKTRIYEDGHIDTNDLTAQGGKITQMEAQLMRNPFKEISDSFMPIDMDNAKSAFIGGPSEIVYTLDWSVNSSGRRQTLVGSISIGAPSGKYFFENGRKYSNFKTSYECSELLGYGTDTEFFGWIVLNRTLFSTNYNFGREITPLAFGRVTGTSSSASFTICKYTNKDDAKISKDSVMRVTRNGEGDYYLYVPQDWFIDSTYIYVELTGYGSGPRSGPIKATVENITSTTLYDSSESKYYSVWRIQIKTSDDSSVNDGSFFFKLYNMGQWDD